MKLTREEKCLHLTEKREMSFQVEWIEDNFYRLIINLLFFVEYDFLFS
jgi:hypothetical protein